MDQTYSTHFPHRLIVYCYKAIDSKEVSGVSTHCQDCSPVPLHIGPDSDYVQRSPTVSGGPGQTPKHAWMVAAWLQEENLMQMAGGCHCFPPVLSAPGGGLQRGSAEVLLGFCPYKNPFLGPEVPNCKSA